MKKTIYKYISITLCMIILSTQILFGSLTVRAHADDLPGISNSFYDNLGVISSSLFGIVWKDISQLGHDLKVFLGLDDDEMNDYISNHYIIDDAAPGQAGHVKVDNTLKNDLTRFLNNKMVSDSAYVYSFNFETVRNRFVDQSAYQSFKNIIDENKDYLCIFANPTQATNTDISVQTLGRQAPRLYVLRNFYYLKSGVLDTTNQLRYSMDPQTSTNTLPSYSNNFDIEVYAFWSTGNTEFAKKTGGTVTFTDEVYNLCASININNFDFDFPSWSSAQRGYVVTTDIPLGYLYFSTTPTGNVVNYDVPYYQVPTQNWSYDGGYYSNTTTNLDNSITYGDISDYISTNNVTQYSTVVNYINNYYSGSGGGSGGGDSGGGSGGDIDWSWLGRIGEVIGGLIAALGNVVAGVIDAIASLIESLTVNLPNTLGQLIAWLMPFLPEEITALLGAFFMVVVIIGVIKLLRR